MYVARDKDGTLKIYFNMPYRHIGMHKFVESGREEIGHDVFATTYSKTDEILEPFYDSRRDFRQFEDFGDDVYQNEYHGQINSSLFPEVTYENGPYDLNTLEFVPKDRLELFTKHWK